MSRRLSAKLTRRQALHTAMAGAIGVIASACAGPTSTPVVEIVEKTKVVEVKQTVQVEVQKVVEKAVVVTTTPAPTVPGSNLAADQTYRHAQGGRRALHHVRGHQR